MTKFEFSDLQKRQFEDDGCLVIENFLSDSECDELRLECSKIVENINLKEHKTRFSTNDHEQMKDDYFLSTNGTIGYFWETEALDNDGNLLFPKHNSLNKIGHALHALNPSFKKVTFDERVVTILRKLGYVRPAVPQSMYIFKPPGIGGADKVHGLYHDWRAASKNLLPKYSAACERKLAVNRHIDATFLFSEPLKLMGLWIALEDATLENSCLKFVKGSHKTTDVSMRMVRNPVQGAYPALVFEGSMDFLPFSQFEATPVKKGSLVLIDGKIQHCSDKNTSNKSRHIYTFHVTETFKSVWNDRNWLQPGGDNMFPAVYDDSSLH